MLRYLPYALSLILTLVSAVLMWSHPAWIWGLVIFGSLAAVGTHDITQRKSTLLRTYPIAAHFRYMLESFGPEIRQYFIESDTSEVPFSRQQRALVYQRAKGGAGNATVWYPA